MAEVPEKVEVTASLEGGEIRFTIEDKERLEAIDKALYMWHPDHVGQAIGMDVDSVEVYRP